VVVVVVVVGGAVVDVVVVPGTEVDVVVVPGAVVDVVVVPGTEVDVVVVPGTVVDVVVVVPGTVVDVVVVPGTEVDVVVVPGTEVDVVVVPGTVVDVVVVPGTVVVVVVGGGKSQETGTPASVGTPAVEILSLPFFVLTFSRFRRAFATFSMSAGVRGRTAEKAERFSPTSHRRLTLSFVPSFRRLALTLHSAVIVASYSGGSGGVVTCEMTSLRLAELESALTFLSVALLMVPTVS
jgi:hypothetical protein